MILSRTVNYRLLVLMVMSVLITACGGGAQSTPVQPTQTPQPASTPMPEIELNSQLPEGDPDKGYLTAIRYGCQGCHANEDHPEKAPRFVEHDNLPNIFERGEVRISNPDYAGRATTNFEYIIESILLPEAYFVPGDWPELMSTFTIHIIEEQEMADIIAWMETLE